MIPLTRWARRLGAALSGEAAASAALALLVYAVGLWWGLPAGLDGHDRPWGTDELGPVGAVNEVYSTLLARQPSFNPQYPLFHYLVQLVFVTPVYAVARVTGELGVPGPDFPYGFHTPTTMLPLLTLVARLPSLLMAAGVVAVAWHTGTVLRDRRVGRWAALVVGLLYPMAFYARTTNVDMGALFWTACGLLVFARCLVDEATAARLRWLAVTAALAAASKDAYYAPFVPVGALAAWWHVRAARQRGDAWSAALRAPALALGLAIVAYAVASGLVFRPARFAQHLAFIRGNGGGNAAFYFRYPWTAAGHRAFAAELGQQVVDTFGWPLLVAAIAGAVVWIRERRLAAWLLPALAAVVLVILPVRFALLRFLLPTGYVLALPAADLLARAWAARGPWRPWGRLVVVVALGFATARTVDLTRQMLHDSRHEATRWLATTMREGDTLGFVSLRRQMPLVPPGSTLAVVTPAGVAEGRQRPEFLVSMPLQDFEPDHEEEYPADTFSALVGGRLGYRLVTTIQSPRWFDRRPATYVNPPIRVFARDDVWRTRLAAAPR